ncbi:MAG TPA: hypothetical protein VNE63_20195 [Candidatus Acidoferrales bacterium]|nr:hypothetical protein [Candidatus Acidoferrales bacterium]
MLIEHPMYPATKVLAANEYLEHHLTVHSDKEQNRRKLLAIFGGEYDVSYENLDDDQKAEVDAFNLSEMLTDALAVGENVDYREVSFVLGRLSALQKPELIPTVIENLGRLYPVADAVAAFFKEFSKLDEVICREISRALLAPILDTHDFKPDFKPSEYYCVWVLNIFEHQREWNHAEDLLRIFRETSSDAIRRSAALRHPGHFRVGGHPAGICRAQTPILRLASHTVAKAMLIERQAGSNLLMQQAHGAQGSVYYYFTVVADESPLPEPIHKKIDSAPCGANHVCQNPLAYLGNPSALVAQPG